MILDTRRLFVALLRVLRIDTVCDVGSMNGADALAFRGVLPRARVVAFEPNPRNLQHMSADKRLRERDVEVLPVAASNFDGECVFHLVRADYSHDNNRRGMSSLLLRRDARLHDAAITVTAARLDSALARDAAPRRLALWVDVEGAACEVLEGAAGLLDELQLLHVEVETAACIAATQKLYPELRRLLEQAGFVFLASDHPVHFEQFNAVFLRRRLPAAERWRVRWHCARIWLRTCAARVFHRLLRTWR